MDFAAGLEEIARCRASRAEASPGLLPDNWVALARVGSTNGLGRRIVGEYFAHQLDPVAALLVAWEQTGGRGRGGRSWSSPAGQGVYVTRILPLAEAAHLSTLPLLVGVGLCRGLNAYLGGACGLKWPNDLLVRGRKIGGILIECVHRGEGGVAVIGFGVNQGQRAGDLPGLAATSLAVELREPPALGELLWRLVAEVERELARLGDPGYAVAAYREFSVHREGQRLSCRVGGERVDGIFRGFDEGGGLLLERDGERVRLSAGEVVQ